MGKLFGTDGIRGIVNDNLDATLALKIGASVAKTLKKESENLTFLVGTDTRISKDVLKFALVSGVLSEGANIIDLGVIPTPAIAYLITKYNADGGFVISASHNPSEYNGIKVFNKDGFKLPDEVEEKIEDLILNKFEMSKEVNKVGTYKVYENEAKEDYVNYLISTVNSDFSNLKVGVDVAYGASFETAKLLFDKLKINYLMINDSPSGLNINDNAGSTHLEGLQKFVVDNNLDLGISFDGDADRCLMVDNLGNIINGDKVLAIYSTYLKKQNLLKNNTVVGTVMSNLGFIKYLESQDINFVATKVGDRYVLQEMLTNDYILGGEQSGHIIFKDYANTGDGELTAIQILEVIKKEGKSLSELATCFTDYPQVLKNVKVSLEGKKTWSNNENIMEVIREVEAELTDSSRVLVRPSGTENLIRVMIEGKDTSKINELCDKIISVMESELN